MENTSLLHLFRTPALAPARTESLFQKVREEVSDAFTCLETEFCYNIAVKAALTDEELRAIPECLVAESGHLFEIARAARARGFTEEFGVDVEIERTDLE